MTRLIIIWQEVEYKDIRDPIKTWRYGEEAQRSRVHPLKQVKNLSKVSTSVQCDHTSPQRSDKDTKNVYTSHEIWRPFILIIKEIIAFCQDCWKGWGRKEESEHLTTVS